MASDDAAIVAEAARRLDAVADAHDCGRDGCECSEGSVRAWRQLAGRFHGWPHCGYAIAPEHARILLARPDAATLHRQIAAAVERTQRPSTGSDQADYDRALDITDAVMAVLAEDGQARDG